jgi:hypothetical protein
MQKKAKITPKGPDKELLMMIALFIVAAAGITIFFIIPQISPVALGEDKSPSINLTSPPESGAQNITECLANYNIESNIVFFIYSDTCTYSNQMKPFVQQLETEGYKFLWIDAKNGSEIQKISACLGDVLEYTGTPEFICPIKEMSISGAFSNMEEMKSFADDCK